MGGCRCSYRNCTVRSDGQTHMFHFPVFDKMRCHQWITNSLKPNFLNLKLSQLRNRVICQHHFTQDNFMNFLMDKLKSNAVPTEDGPYCIPDQIQPMIEDNDKPVIAINADDIENEQMNSMEKKAHSSVKYGDFLISDVTELFNSSTDNQKVSTKTHANKNKIFNVGNVIDAKCKLPNHEEIRNYTIIYSNDEQARPTYQLGSVKVANPDISGIEEPSKLNVSFEVVDQLKHSESSNPTVYQSSSVQENNTDKIVILSEKTISEPVVVEGELQPISPSMIIRRPLRKIQSGQVFQLPDMKPQINNESGYINLQPSNNNVRPLEQPVLYTQTVPIEYEPKDSKTIDQNYQNLHQNMDVEKQIQIINVDNIEYQNNLNDHVHKQNEIPLEQAFLNCMIEKVQKIEKPDFFPKSKETPLTPTSTPAYKSILKTKITPEKLAAIEQKRKFNLKLRDVITSCLDNMDEPNDVDKKFNIDKKCSPEKRQVIKRNLRLKAHSPVSSQGSMVSYLEARLQRMEDTLLNKIDLNTQRINELKRTIKPSKNARHANTQTQLNMMPEESQKQYLYKEISRFLSPNANIKIYEELFLGKTSTDDSENSTPRKLRRRR